MVKLLNTNLLRLNTLHNIAMHHFQKCYDHFQKVFLNFFSSSLSFFIHIYDHAFSLHAEPDMDKVFAEVVLLPLSMVAYPLEHYNAFGITFYLFLLKKTYAQ